MSKHRVFNIILSLMMAISMLLGSSQVFADPGGGTSLFIPFITNGQGVGPAQPGNPPYLLQRPVTQADREASAANKAKAMQAVGVAPQAGLAATPGSIPDYFGTTPNWAFSPLPIGSVASITVDAPGSGYTAPLVDIQDAYGNGSGASASATFDATGAITGFTILFAGSGYVAPVVTITDPTGTGAAASAVIAYSTAPGGIRKFVDPLPSLTIAVPDTTSYPGSDFYEIHLRQYAQKLHSDLPPTTLRGYVQVNASGTDVAPISYLGPVIVATRDRPVRIKFVNQLSTGAGGNLFIPVDTTYMGAGEGPKHADGTSCDPMMDSTCVMYTQNRADLHLHGGTTPWISDGTPHQWITPAGENTQYPQGVSVQDVPDMNMCGAANDGCTTLFYSNQQSARLMFYHDHSYGITRLNVYAGEAAGYLLTDSVEQTLINGGTINYTDPAGNPKSLVVAQGTLPGIGTPLVIQDKSFVDANTILKTDPTWNWGTTNPLTPNTGDLWFPHVYMPNQNPYDVTGTNAMGRWDYGPWFWPPFVGLTKGPIPNPYCLPTPPAPGSTEAIPGVYDCSQTPWEAPFIPAMDNPSGTPEAFGDTPLVNGAAYPTLTVDPKLTRFRILSAGNDRYLNLSLWVADPAVTTVDGRTNTEVKMVPFNSSQNLLTPFPSWWYTAGNPFTLDDRAGGVPDPTTRGPAMIQIGTEGGFLPGPAVIKNQPVNFDYNRKSITVLNVLEHSLLLGPAERADVLVDFSNFAGKTLILYNDAPAPDPASDPRLDYYTGDPNQTSTGGAPSTLAGFGPNSRTIMQIVVTGSGGTAPVDDVNPATLVTLNAALPAAFAASQETIIQPQTAYNPVYGTNVLPTDASQYVKISDSTHTFTPIGQPAATKITMDLQPKAIQELFTLDYGRMNATLGVEIPNTNGTIQTTIPYGYIDPPTELIKVSDSKNVQTTPLGTLADGTQIWKITHNGVDTHVIHTHMFVMQLINRVGWDGMIKPPDANELGWKDTYRMNPLEDVIVAVRPIMLKNLPFDLPNSVRPLDVTRPVGAMGNPANTPGFFQVGPDGNPMNPLITNQALNFGWEYVWHCHILGHEENDMMRPMIIAVPPNAPSNLSIALKGSSAILTWKDNSANETGFVIQRASNSAFTTSLVTWNVGAGVTTFTDTSYKSNQTYYYQVVARNRVGSTQSSLFIASIGGTYPTMDADSKSVVIGAPAGTTTLLTLTQGILSKSPVSLTWSYSPLGDQTGFRIQRATNAAFTSGLTTFTVGANVFSYSDATIKVGTTYYYRVIPFNLLGSGTPSASKSILTH